MDTQTIFDTVAEHLLEQGERSRRAYVGCAYRGDGGLMCAVGCLISDEAYEPEMDDGPLGGGGGYVASALIETFPGCLGFDPTPEQLGLLQGLQDLHDTQSPRNWAKGLRRIAQGGNVACSWRSTRSLWPRLDTKVLEGAIARYAPDAGARPCQ